MPSNSWTRWRGGRADALDEIDNAHVTVGGDPTLHLPRVRAWRRAVAALADAFDQTMYDYLASILGSPPW
jgi:hypothetical protein